MRSDCHREPGGVRPTFGLKLGRQVLRSSAQHKAGHIFIYSCEKQHRAKTQGCCDSCCSLLGIFFSIQALLSSLYGKTQRSGQVLAVGQCQRRSAFKSPEDGKGSSSCGFSCPHKLPSDCFLSRLSNPQGTSLQHLQHHVYFTLC